MPDVISTTLSLGKDSYGRPVTMTRRRSYDGRILWSITIEAANQRDDTQHIDGLTDENVREMTQALGVMGGRNV